MSLTPEAQRLVRFAEQPGVTTEMVTAYVYTARMTDAERIVFFRAWGILLPGWWCACGAFNGEEKEARATCRACDGARP